MVGAVAELSRLEAVTHDTFAFMKRSSALDEVLARGIPLAEGWLLPVGEVHLGDPGLIEAMARWRAQHMSVFPTQFHVTIDGTRRWLAEQILGHPDRLLLLVGDRLGRPVGHLGFSLARDAQVNAMLGSDRTLEYGYLVRGERCAPGLMSDGLRTAIRWCHETLGPEHVYSLTLADNARALDFHARVGAVVVGSIALRRCSDGERIEYRRLENGASGDHSFVVARYPREGAAQETDSVSLAGPSITEREVAYTLDAVRHGWNERRSDYLERFAERFAAAVGVRYALPVSSCTGAMHLALLALGVGAGDEVVVPDMTWVATANAVALTGATPVFADVELDSWGLDPDALQAVVGPRTRAVLPVHLYGYPARIDEIRAVCEQRGLPLLEDAAAAVGAELEGRPIGSWGSFAAFSFQGAKVLVAGEGGMLVTDDEHLYERAAHLWDQARGEEHPFWCDAVTPKYKMSNVQAALGLAQLERLGTLLEAKRRLHAWYCEELGEASGVTVLRGLPGTRATHWMTSLLIDDVSAISRDELIRQLRRRGIDTRPTFPSLSSLPMWRSQDAQCANAAWIAERGLNLPSGVRLGRDQVSRVASAIRELVAPRRRSRG